MKELTVMQAHVDPAKQAGGQAIHKRSTVRSVPKDDIPRTNPPKTDKPAAAGRKLLGDLKRTISHRIMNNALEEQAWKVLMQHHGFIQPVELIRFLVKMEFSKVCMVNDYIDKALNTDNTVDRAHNPKAYEVIP